METPRWHYSPIAVWTISILRELGEIFVSLILLVLILIRLPVFIYWEIERHF